MTETGTRCGANGGSASIKASVVELVDNGVPDLAGGDTATRWDRLYEWARRGSVSAARLAEAHLDATAILAEAGHSADPDASVYGVWASSPGSTATLSKDHTVVRGIKPFCSGVGLVDRALVTVTDLDSEQGCLVEIDTANLKPPPPWAGHALRDTLTGPADLGSCRVVRTIGTADWYLDRPGFWHGALGPAACWAGAAAGLVDAALRDPSEDPHRLAAHGELTALRISMESVLEAAGAATDRDPTDRSKAKQRALASRHIIERTASAIADLYSRTVGPRPFVSDPDVVQRHADLHLYVRQHHGARDLELLGRSVAT